MSSIIGQPIAKLIDAKLAELEELKATIADVAALKVLPCNIYSFSKDDFAENSAEVRRKWSQDEEKLNEHRCIAQCAILFLNAISELETRGYSEAAYNCAVDAKDLHASAVSSRKLRVLERVGCYGDGEGDTEEASVMNDMLLLFTKPGTA